MNYLEERALEIKGQRDELCCKNTDIFKSPNTQEMNELDDQLIELFNVVFENPTKTGVKKLQQKFNALRRKVKSESIYAGFTFEDIEK